jgi:hypothetical protein
MAITCKNCFQQYEGNFCNNCGQSADTQKLNFRFLITDLQKLVLKYFHKGILYTSTQLFTRPGHTIREYIEGKRVKHIEPLTMLVMMATLYGVLYHYFQINLFAGISISATGYEKIDFKAINEWISTHFSLTTFFALPVYTLASFTVFRKEGYNFVEHLYLNTFLATQRLLLRIATFPLFAVYNGTPQIHTIANIYVAADVVLMIWSYSQFFNKLKKVKSILFSALSYVIFYIFLLALILIGLYIGSILTNK